MGGKTGTLSSRELGGLTEWFVGFAPAENPEVGVVAFSVGNSSPVKPQYIAMRILQAYFRVNWREYLSLTGGLGITLRDFNLP